VHTSLLVIAEALKKREIKANNLAKRIFIIERYIIYNKENKERYKSAKI
jgi:hypothetical protein